MGVFLSLSLPFTIKHGLFFFNYGDSLSCSTLTEMWAFRIFSHFDSAWIGSRHSHGFRGHESWFESEISSTSSYLECCFLSWWHYFGEDCGTFWWWDLAHSSRLLGAQPLSVIAWLLVLSSLLSVPLWCKQPMIGIAAAVSQAAWPGLPLHDEDSLKLWAKMNSLSLVSMHSGHRDLKS